MIPVGGESEADLRAGRSASEMAGRRTLVIGINGFIGCHVAAAAKRAGAEILGVDLPHTTESADRMRASLGAAGAKAVEVQRLDGRTLGDILADFKAEVVLHLAGVTRRDTTPEAWNLCTEANVVLTASVIGAVTGMPEASRPAIVMPGSQMEYGLAPMPWTEERTAMPGNPYGASKLAAAALLQTAVRIGAARGCVVRLPLVFGPGQAPAMLIPEMIGKALRGIDIRMSSGEQRRRFLFAGDLAECLLAIGARLARGRSLLPLLNAPACEPVRLVDMARQLMDLLGTPVELRVGAIPYRKNEQMDAWPDSTLADGMNLIAVTPLEQGLARTVAWYRENPWFVSAMRFDN